MERFSVEAFTGGAVKTVVGDISEKCLRNKIVKHDLPTRTTGGRDDIIRTCEVKNTVNTS